MSDAQSGPAPVLRFRVFRFRAVTLGRRVLCASHRVTGVYGARVRVQGVGGWCCVRDARVYGAVRLRVQGKVKGMGSGQG